MGIGWAIQGACKAVFCHFRLLCVSMLLVFFFLGDFLSKTLCISIPEHEVCVIQLVHFVNRDSLGLASDFLSLGFIPEGVDIQSVSDALKSSFGDGSRQSQDFQVINEVFSRSLCGVLYLFVGVMCNFVFH